MPMDLPRLPLLPPTMLQQAGLWDAHCTSATPAARCTRQWTCVMHPLTRDSPPSAGRLVARTLYLREAGGAMHPAVDLRVSPGPGFHTWRDRELAAAALADTTLMVANGPLAQPAPGRQSASLLAQVCYGVGMC